MAAVDSTLKALLQPVVEALDCELWGLELQSGGKRKLLRIYIDREDGIGVEDCERVSRQSGSVLDVEDPITGEYTLEVSSPGMDRLLFKLEQYPAYVGEMMAIPVMGLKAITDLVDHHTATADQFNANLITASRRLAEKLLQVIDFCAPRSVADLG